MKRYFKLVALDDKEWLIKEFLAGRARFGWSGPGSDLRILRDKSEFNEDERITWRYTQFLTERLSPGDRLVCQFEQPLREFWLGEITEKAYEFDSEGRDDFNHIVNILPLSQSAIPVNAKYVPASLKHDLTKRGHYYEIYPEESIICLDRIINEMCWKTANRDEQRTHADEFDESRAVLIEKTISEIHTRWKSKDFETFCENLFKSIDYIEVHSKEDTNQGWDLLIRVVDPITSAILLDEVPVQCKNFSGEVTETRAIDDLERCIRNSDSDIAYLFIIGSLSTGFRLKVDALQEKLSIEFRRKISLRLVEQETIAELYLKLLQKDRRSL